MELPGQSCSPAGVDGGPLFRPRDYGIMPAGISTACWRGYVCWYEVADDQLRLSKLLLGAGSKVDRRKIGPGTTLLGTAAVAGDSGLRGFQAEGIDLPLPFTGGLLLGLGFLPSTYVHMGFHPACRFETVVELVLEDGRVTTHAG